MRNLFVVGILAVLGCGEAAVGPEPGHPTQVTELDEPEKSLEKLRSIATRTLRVGQTAEDVRQAVGAEGVNLIHVDFGMMRVTHLYGTGSLADPVMYVFSELDADGMHRVSGWTVEGPSKAGPRTGPP